MCFLLQHLVLVFMSWLVGLLLSMLGEYVSPVIKYHTLYVAKLCHSFFFFFLNNSVKIMWSPTHISPEMHIHLDECHIHILKVVSFILVCHIINVFEVWNGTWLIIPLFYVIWTDVSFSSIAVICETFASVTFHWCCCPVAAFLNFSVPTVGCLLLRWLLLLKGVLGLTSVHWVTLLGVQTSPLLGVQTSPQSLVPWGNLAGTCVSLL